MMSVGKCDAPEPRDVKGGMCQVRVGRSSLFALLAVTGVACSSGSGAESEAGVRQVDVGLAANGGSAGESGPTATGGSAGLDGFRLLRTGPRPACPRLLIYSSGLGGSA
jgi:hypothetical protein